MNKKFTKLIAAVALLVFMTPSMVVWGQTRTGTETTYTWSNKAWGDATNSWESDNDGFQYNSSGTTNVQVTASYSGAGAHSKNSISNITKISVNAATTSKGVGNIKVKVGNGDEQTICSLSKNTTYNDYELEFDPAVSGVITFVVNCSNNSMYMHSISVTTDDASGPTQLTAPTNFSATAGNAQATFSWTEVDHASNYTILAKNGDTWDNPTTLFDNVSLTNGQYVGTGLSNGTTYVCKVRANGDGTNYSNSALSEATATFTPTAAQQYTVTIADGITGGTVGANPTTATAGTEISLTNEPAAGYGFTSWNVYKTGDQNTTVSVTNDKFNMPDYDVTVSATFTPYTVTLNVNGSTSTWNVTLNGGNLPDAAAPCASWSFYGWSTSAVGSQTTTAPTTMVNGTGYTPTGDITLYAVYKKTEGGGSNTDSSVTLSNGVFTDATSTDPAYITWTEDFITIVQEKGSNSNASPVANYTTNPRWYQHHVITMTPTGTINSITITQYDGKYGLEDSGTSITNGSASVDNHVVTITPTNGNQAVVITMGAQARISAISVNHVASTTYYHSTPDCVETVATPSFDVNEGTYYEPQIIIIECETAGAAIYYTLNGDEPTDVASSTNFLYDENEGVEISTTKTLKAKAFKAGMNPSATASATYTIIHDVAEPTLAESQLFTTDTYSVAITVPANTTVYYTTDGTAPTNASTPYTAAFDINATTTVKAIAYDGDGCASDVVTATFTRAYTLAAAKALYVDQNVPNITISLTDVQFIAKSGSSTYMQQGTTGLMIYGSHSQDLTNGDVFTAGTVTGTITKYGENLELSISSGAFANVAKTAGTLAASATDVGITDVTGGFSTYESRYVSLTSLEMDLDNLELSDGTNTLAIYDPFHVLDEAIQPDDNVTVTGVVTSYYKNSNTTYQIIPLAKSGITTGIAATLPTLTPAGGADAANAVSIANVKITPATGTTVDYVFGSGSQVTITQEITVDVPSTEAISLTVMASRDFYEDNMAEYYYKSNAASYTVNFYENGELTYYEENVVSGTSLAISSTTAPNGYVFMGWTTAAISGVQAGAPATLYNGSVTVEDDMNLYAVYALEGETNVTYTLVGAGSVTAGTYLIGALRSESTPENDYFYFADGSISSGDMNTDDNYVEIEAVSGVRQITQKPSAAQEFVFTGDNTNGFTICKAGTTDYLGYSSAANRKIAFGNTYSTYAWTVFEKTDLMANGVRLKKSNDYYIGENSTGTSSIRGYITNTGRAIYLFKKAETASYSNYCTSVTILSGNISGNYTTGAYSIDANNGATIQTGTTLTAAVLGNANPNALEIEDGGQLITDSKGVQATVVKHINKYNSLRDNYYLLASPIKGEIAATDVTDMLENTYDLYYFDADQETEEWQNYKVNTFAIANEKGYLYANSGDVDLEFSGELVPSNEDVTIPLTYAEENAPKFNGWNLVGNPFPCNATPTITDFYVISGTEVQATTYGTVAPCEAIFVKATAATRSVTFSKATTAGNNSNLLNISLSKDGANMDKAFVRFGQGEGLPKFMLNADNTKISLDQSGVEYAVVYSEAEAELPVNFKASENGSYTLSVKPEDVEMSYLHLIDNMTGADVDLLATPSYSFEARTTDYASRFRLVFSANNGSNENGNETFAYYNGSEWVISNMGDATLQVVDMMGRVMRSISTDGACTVSTSNLVPGVYMLRLVNNENVRTQKIVVR